MAPSGDSVPERSSASERLATACLFLVIVTIVLGLKVYSRSAASLTVVLIGLAALFAWPVNRTLIRFGWI